MDVEDENYLYLNDSGAPNAYLLENNEVGLFAVEPIFTEMATDWPQEGFPLLLTNSLIAEEEPQNQVNTQLRSAGNPCGTETLAGSVNLQRCSPSPMEKHAQTQITSDTRSVDNVNDEANDVEFPQKNVSNIVSNDGTLRSNVISFGQTDLGHASNEAGLMDDSSVQLCSSTAEDVISASSKQEVDIKASMKLKPNENYILVKSNNSSQNQMIQLINSDGTPIPIDSSILASFNLPKDKKYERTEETTENKKSRTINDLFSTVIANKCKICSFLCEDLEQIKRHICMKHPECVFTHNGISNGLSILSSNVKNKLQESKEINKEYTIYVCSECRGVCTDKSDLQKHMIQEHGLSKESTAMSPKDNIDENNKVKATKSTAYLDDVNVSLVKKQENAIQRVKCTVNGCSAAFPTQELRMNHEKLHIGDTKSMFKCLECDKTFMMWSITKNHMYKEHNVDFGMIICPICNNYKSYRTVTMFRHMMIHSEINPFMCSDCGKSFNQLSQLKNHEVFHRVPEDRPAWSRVKKCDKCDRFFANPKSLKAHIKTIHEKIKPFICNICGHKSSRKAMLELHMRQHTASKPLKCDYCEFRTGDPASLRKHKMKHLGIIGYQCPYCPYNCIQTVSIKNHFIRKHKDKEGIYSCSVCPFTTINEMYLRSHEKKHESSSKEDISRVESSAVQQATADDADIQTDEETQCCFLNTESHMEDTVDNGGITIPANLEMPLVS